MIFNGVETSTLRHLETCMHFRTLEIWTPLQNLRLTFIY